MNPGLIRLWSGRNLFCFSHVFIISDLYTQIFHSLFITFKLVTNYTAIKSTALHGPFQDASCWHAYAEDRSGFLSGLLNARL